MTKQVLHYTYPEQPSSRVICAQRLKYLTKYAMVKWFQVFCGIYIMAVTFSKIGTFGEWGGLRDPETGFIIDVTSEENTRRGIIMILGDERAIVANSVFQMIALAFSRLSAFTMYPVLIAVFWSKFRATTNFISRTYFGELFVYKDSLHDLHVYCGYYILVDGTLHTVFHIARYASQGNLRLLIEHPSGVSGLVIIASTLLICFPMMIGKQMVRFEIRKYVHYLFVVFMVAMCFHVPRSGGFAPYVFGMLLAWWALDNLYVQCFMTERITSSHFYVLPSGVQLTMAVSERFQKWGSGGNCYVCLPWVDRYQWHAFSLFENPAKPEERQVFIHKSGDWTNQVHDALGRQTSRPVWVQGPFVSPFGNAVNYDNHIMVAGGIGITPALSVIRELKHTRRCNLIWATRDRHMLDFFIKHAEFDEKGWNLVFYTGKQPLLGIEDVVVTSHGATVYIIRERPKLHWVLPNIILSIESGICLPEMLVPDDKELAPLRCTSTNMVKRHGLITTGSWKALARMEMTERDLSDDEDSDIEAAPLKSTTSIELYRPWTHHEEAGGYVANLSEAVLAQWGVMYCGGKTPLEKALKEAARKADIEMHTESFAW